MKTFNQFKEAGFTDKQSTVLADVIGLIRRDIEKLKSYIDTRLAVIDTRLNDMDTRLYTMDTRISSIEKKMEKGFAKLESRLWWIFGTMFGCAVIVIGLLARTISILADAV